VKRLGWVLRRDRLDRLEFEDDPVLDEQIAAIIAHLPSAEIYGNGRLLYNLHPGFD